MKPTLSRIARGKRRRTLTWSILILLTLCAGWISLNSRNLREMYETSQRRQNEEQKLRRIQKQYELMQGEIERLRQSDFDNEKRLREQLKVMEPGEKMILLETPEVSP